MNPQGSSPVTGNGHAASQGDILDIEADAAVVAHELRQPLTTMLVGIATLRAHWDRLESGQRQSILTTVERHGHRMNVMIDDLLEANRPDGDAPRRAGAASSTIRVRSLILRAMESSGVDGSGVVVECDPILSVATDPHRAEQLLANLLANAARHGRPPIMVSAHADGDSVRFAVRDHGLGVPPDRVDDLFVRWSELSDGGADSHGLGLYIVSELATTLGGDVAYEAASPGARFVVNLSNEATPAPGVAAREAQVG